MRIAFGLQGMAMQSIIAAMAERNGPPAVDFDFVMVAGHFLARDENIFTYFEVGTCVGSSCSRATTLLPFVRLIMTTS